MILLDTQVLVWLVGDDRRLGREARSSIKRDTERRVSAMVSWEIAMLVDKGRFTLEMPLGSWLDTSIRSVGAYEAAVTGAMARDAGSLPGRIHGDPCDRIMIATARALSCALVTSDEKILHYAAQGHLTAIDARR
ncbi:type II toxin-antitoxin system VapC family toxin [Sphingomonas sp. SUN019]|uniref:type II toxin-antitoxin system VapC family toxin n=1 Tax=Sphingomonas sp. SUN019 TaxID=2937788 RepID=UPI0021642960|nr:type II toxin-antitoxin system VapC family toxin [Sphingomonas sp. SUN019]UVO50408.1 type II toxin-antitoxin system VapC family toxin [Sphingomonas sp. SUN019]